MRMLDARASRCHEGGVPPSGGRTGMAGIGRRPGIPASPKNASIAPIADVPNALADAQKRLRSRRSDCGQKLSGRLRVAKTASPFTRFCAHNSQ